MSYRRILLVALVFVAGACASASSSAGAGSAESRSRTVITQEEIRSSSAATAFDAVRALRPAWLVKRGPQSVSFEPDIVVYLGRARLGGVETLREIAAGTLISLEFFDPAAANFRFGAGHPYGAIVVSTVNPAAR